MDHLQAYYGVGDGERQEKRLLCENRRGHFRQTISFFFPKKKKKIHGQVTAAESQSKTSLHNVTWTKKKKVSDKLQGSGPHPASFKTHRSSLCGPPGSYMRCQRRLAATLSLNKFTYGDRIDKRTISGVYSSL